MRVPFPRVLAAAAIAALAVLASGLPGTGPLPQPEAAAVGAGDALGEYVVKLKGAGFDRNASSGRVTQGNIRGRALLRVSRVSDDGDPRNLRVEIVLERALEGSVIDRATPSPALEGRGILVGDSLTVIGAGQSNFVNAVTLRFLKRGRKVEGWWLASFPGSEVKADAGFVSGMGLQLKGKRLRKPGSITLADVSQSTGVGASAR